MFAGGQVTTTPSTNVDNLDIFQQTVQFQCGGAFIGTQAWNGADAATRQTWVSGLNSAAPDYQECFNYWHEKFSYAYSVLTSPEQRFFLERGVQGMNGNPYFSCVMNPGQGAQSVTATGVGLTTETAMAGSACMAGYSTGQTPINVSGVDYVIRGTGETYFDALVKMIQAGFNPSAFIDEFIYPPASVMDAIQNQLLGPGVVDVFGLTDDVIVLYREAILDLPEEDRGNIIIQEQVGMSIVSQLAEAKTKGTEDITDDLGLLELQLYTIKHFVDNVDEQGSNYIVNLEELPPSLISDLNLQNSDKNKLREIHRLYVQAENMVKNNHAVDAHLATLSRADRTSYLAPIRSALAAQLAEAAAPKIEELNKYDAVAEFTVSGTDVTITDVKLIPRTVSVGGMPFEVPAALIQGLNARPEDDLRRFFHVRRIWGDVLINVHETNPELLEAMAQGTLQGNELEAALVGNLIEQLHDSSTEDIAHTDVTGVTIPDDVADSTVSLTRSTNSLYDSSLEPASEAAVVQILHDLRDQAIPMVSGTVDYEALDAAIWRAIRPYVYQTTPPPGWNPIQDPPYGIYALPYLSAGSVTEQDTDGDTVADRYVFEPIFTPPEAQGTGGTQGTDGRPEFQFGTPNEEGERPGKLMLDIWTIVGGVFHLGGNDSQDILEEPVEGIEDKPTAEGMIIAEPSVTLDYTVSDSFNLSFNTTFFALYTPALLNPDNNYSAFTTAESTDSGGGIKQMQLTLNGLFGDTSKEREDMQYRLTGIVGPWANSRMFAGSAYDPTGLGNSNFWWGGQPVAGSTRVPDAQLQFNLVWPNDSAIGIAAEVGAAKSSGSFSDFLFAAGLKYGVGLGGVANIGDTVSLSVAGTYTGIYDGFTDGSTIDGNFTATVHPGICIHAHPVYADICGAYRFVYTQVEDIPLLTHTFGLSGSGVAYRGESWDLGWGLGLEGSFTSGDMRIGGDPLDEAPDPMNDDTGDDAGPISVMETLEMSGISLMANLDFHLGFDGTRGNMHIIPMFGPYWSGESASNMDPNLAAFLVMQLSWDPLAPRETEQAAENE